MIAFPWDLEPFHICFFEGLVTASNVSAWNSVVSGIAAHGVQWRVCVFPGEDELVALEAIASSLSKLVMLEGCTELIAPITEPTAVENLCKAREAEWKAHRKDQTCPSSVWNRNRKRLTKYGKNWMKWNVVKSADFCRTRSPRNLWCYYSLTCEAKEQNSNYEPQHNIHR